jgi:REP element-mobilizing transposase RayT
MPRKQRQEAPGAIHHVVAKGNAGNEIVRDDIDRSALLERLARATELHRWSCIAYCLMDNHFHLVVQTPEANLGIGMKGLKAAYAQDFNYRHGRSGHVFGGRFYSEIVTREAHLTEAIVYVILNPVRAGIVQRPERWRWSSYAATIGLVPAPAFLDDRKVLELVDGRREVARRLLMAAVAEAVERNHRVGGKATRSGVRPVGSDPSTLASAASRDTGVRPVGSDPTVAADLWGQTPRV